MDEFNLTSFLSGGNKDPEQPKETSTPAAPAVQDAGSGSDFDLTKFIGSGQQKPTANKDDYGILDRQRDTVIAETGEDIGKGEALARNLIPFVGDEGKSSRSAELIQLQKLYDGSAMKDITDRREKGLRGDDAAGERKNRNMVFDAVNQSSFMGNSGFGTAYAQVQHARAQEKKTPEETYFDQLDNVAKNAGIDPETRKKLRESSTTVDEFAEKLRGAAEGELKAYATRRKEAQARLQENEPGAMATIVNGLITNTGYQGKYLVGGLSGGLSLAVVAAQSAEQRALALQTKDYDVDEEGNLVVIHNDDSAGKAAVKGIAGGVAEVAVEQFLEKALGLGKHIPGIGKYLGKASNAVSGLFGKAAGAAGAKLSKNAAGKWLVGAAQNFGKYQQYTGVNGLPMEMLEEHVQDFADDVLGFNVKGRDQGTLGSDAKDWWHNKFWNAEHNKDLFLGLIGTMAVQGVYAGAKAHHKLKKWRQNPAGFLKTVLDEKTVDKLSDAEVAHMYKLVSSPGFTKDKVDRFLGHVQGRTEMANALMELREANMPFFDTDKNAVDDAVKSGSVKSQFTPPTTDVTGGKKLDWQPFEWKDGTKTMRIFDQNTGIAIDKIGTGNKFCVTNRDGLRIVVDGETDGDASARALSVADKMSIHNQLLDAKRPAKEKYIKKRIAETAQNGKFLLVKNAADLDKQFPELKKSPEYSPDNPALKLGDGRIVLVTDNLKSAQEVNRMILHEAAIHSGLDKKFTTEQKRKFLKSINDPAIERYKANIDAQREARGLAPVDWDSDVGVEESFAHVWDRRRANPLLTQKINHFIREVGRSMHLPVSYNADDLEVIVEDMQRNIRKPGGKLDESKFDTTNAADSIPYNQGQRDFSGDVADVSKPSGSTEGGIAARNMQRNDRIKAAHPHLWEYAMRQSGGDEDAAAEYVSDRLEDEGRRGVSGEMDHAHHALMVAEKLENGEDLSADDMEILDEHGFTGQVLYKDYGYRKQKNGSWKLVGRNDNAAHPELAPKSEPKTPKFTAKAVPVTVKKSNRQAKAEFEKKFVESLKTKNGGKIMRLPASSVKTGDGRIVQFKEDADPKSGIVPGNELEGDYDETVAGLPVVGHFPDGEYETITGRHRIKRAQELGIDINVMVLEVSEDGRPGTISIADAEAIDAKANIKDGKGTIKDYIKFFRHAKMTKAEAEKEGLLGKKTQGRKAFALYNDATPELTAAVDFDGTAENDDRTITPEQAGIIAMNAPKDGHKLNGAVQRSMRDYCVKHPKANGDRLARLTQAKAHQLIQAEKDGQLKENGDGQMFLFADMAADVAATDKLDEIENYKEKRNAEYRKVANQLRDAKNSKGRLQISPEFAQELDLIDTETGDVTTDKKRLEAAAQEALGKAFMWTRMELPADMQDELEKALKLGKYADQQDLPVQNEPAGDLKLPRPKTEAANGGKNGQSRQTRENGPLSRPSEKGTTSRPDEKNATATQNPASGGVVSVKDSMKAFVAGVQKRQNGENVDLASAQAKITQAVKAAVKTDETMPTIEEIQQIAKSLPESQRDLVVKKFHEQANWVAEQREKKPDGAKTDGVKWFSRKMDPGWGDETRKVPIVGGGKAAWQFVRGKKASEAKKELLPMAFANIRSQKNYIESGNEQTPCLKLDGKTFKITSHGLFHAGDRRLKHIGPAIAVFGDVLNASVEVPGIESPWHYRIAEVNFGTPSFVLITAKESQGAEEIVNLQTLYSVNVKTDGSARELNHTKATRQTGEGTAQAVTPTNADLPTESSIANLREAWQGLFEKDLAEHIRTSGAAKDKIAIKKGEVGIQAVRKLFGSLVDQNDKDALAIAKKVFPIAEKLGVRFAFTDINDGYFGDDAYAGTYGIAYWGHVEFDVDSFTGNDLKPNEKAQVILHETIHSVTQYAIQAVYGKNEANIKITDELRRAVEDLRQCFEETRYMLDRRKATNYATRYMPEAADGGTPTQEEILRARLCEFVAELANPEVRDVLKKQSVWTRIVDSVKRVIDELAEAFSENADTQPKTPTKEENAYAVTLEVLDRFLSNAVPNLEAFRKEQEQAANLGVDADRFGKRGFARIASRYTAHGNVKPVAVPRFNGTAEERLKSVKDHLRDATKDARFVIGSSGQEVDAPKTFRREFLKSGNTRFFVALSYNGTPEEKAWADRILTAKASVAYHLKEVVEAAQDRQHRTYEEAAHGIGHEKTSAYFQRTWGGGSDDYAVLVSVPDENGKEVVYSARVVIHTDTEGNSHLYDIVDFNDNSDLGKKYVSNFNQRHADYNRENGLWFSRDLDDEQYWAEQAKAHLDAYRRTFGRGARKSSNVAAKPPPDGGGITFESTNAWREAYSFEPMRKSATVHDDDVKRRADTLFNNREEVDLRIRAVADHPRAISDVETLAFAMRRREFVNDFERLMETQSEALDRGNMAQVEELNGMVASLEKQIETVDNALRLSGSAQGRAFRLRRMKILNDLSLGGLIGDMGARAHRKLTPEEMNEIKGLYDALRKSMEESDAAVLKELAKRMRNLAFGEVGRMVGQNPAGTRTRTAEEVSKALEDAVVQMRAWADAGAGQLLGLDGAQSWVKSIMRHHITHGAADGLTGAARYDALMNATLGTIRESLPNTTMEMLEQALSGYGYLTPLSHEETDKIIREQTALARLHRQLEDLAKGLRPLKTGSESEPPSEEQRRLAKEVREKMKELGFDMRSSAERLKTALDAAKTRLRNQIADLNDAIERHRKLPRQTPGVEYDAEAEALLKERDELQKRYDEIFYDPAEAHETAVQRNLRLLEKRLALAKDALERAQSGDFSKKKCTTVEDERLDRLRKEIENVNAETEQLKALAFPDGTPEEIQARIALRIRSLNRSIDRWKDALDREDFLPKKRRPPVTNAEIEAKERVRAAAFRKIQQKRKWYEQQNEFLNVKIGKNYLFDYWDMFSAAPRILRTMLDLSATGAQGAALFVSHPIEGMKALAQSVRAWNEKNADAIQAAFDADPDWAEFQKFGGHAYRISDADDRLDVPEEFWLTDASVKIGDKELSIDKIPGVKASERSFGVFLNTINLAMYKAMKNGGGWLDGAGPTDQQKRDLAEALNVASGYGYARTGTGFWDRVMGTAFWAPRFAIAGMKQAIGYNVWSPFVRGKNYEKTSAERVNSSKQMAKMWAREHVAKLAWTALLTLLLGRDDPDWLNEVTDPRSSNFMNFRIGNTNLNVWGPEKQWLTLFARLVTGQNFRYGVANKNDRTRVMGNFIRGKLSPIVSTVYDVGTGEDYLGNKLDWGKFTPQKDGEKVVSGVGHLVEGLGIPLTLSDMFEAYRENSLAHALLLAPFVTTGFAKNTYQLDEYALVVDSYKAVSREYDKLRKDRNWVAAAEFYKEHPILRHKPRLDNAIKAVGVYEKHVKQMEKAGRPVSETLIANRDKAKLRAMDAIKAARQK